MAESRRDVKAERKVLRVHRANADLKNSTIGTLFVDMFEIERDDNLAESDFLSRFVRVLGEDIDAMGVAIGNDMTPDDCSEILSMYARRCQIALEIQRRLDDANPPEPRLRVVDDESEPEASEVSAS
jgi:hypothetical protein